VAKWFKQAIRSRFPSSPTGTQAAYNDATSAKATQRMRLTPHQTETVKHAARRHFGANAHVWLFGSRVDDQAAGGDIDLYVEPEIQYPAELVEAKLHFLLELHKQLGDQKIDVVIRRAAYKEELPIYRIARETGVKLL
jgi:predicted nucleotidyltransferase